MNLLPSLQNEQPLSDLSAAPIRNSVILAVISAILLALLGHYFVASLERTLRSIPDLSWNFFVWMLPTSAILSLPPSVAVPPLDSLPPTDRQSTGHAAKSNLIRDALGLSPGSKAQSTPSKNSAKGPAGLGNWDNSCYQNSVLQALASLAPLTRFFSELEALEVPASTESTLGALKELVHKLNEASSSNSATTIWTPAKLKSMSSWQQQDAQEYYSKIMDDLENDALAILRRRQSATTPSLDLSAIVDLAPVGLQQHRNGSLKRKRTTSGAAKELQDIASPLDGLLAQRVGCTRCGYVEGLSLVPFNYLTLPLGSNWNYDIAECLDDFTGLEMIDGVECAKCSLLQARHHLRRQTELAATPSEEDKESVTIAELHEYTATLQARLASITQALEDEDFSESTLSQKCLIGRKQRVNSTKSRQCMLMRTPQCLVIHFNRSKFDERSGTQTKNYADVRYRGSFDISPWCVGNKVNLDVEATPATVEQWEMDPMRSMAAHSEYLQPTFARQYRLSAVITHYGRHDNGHYICYRKSPLQGTSEACSDAAPAAVPVAVDTTEAQWWRMSDEEVSAVSEEDACGQGGVFMLFYECVNGGGTLDSFGPTAGSTAPVATQAAATEGVDAKVHLDADMEQDVADREDSIPYSRTLPGRAEAGVPASTVADSDGTAVHARVSSDALSPKSAPISPAAAEDPSAISEATPHHLMPPTMKTARDWQRPAKQAEHLRPTRMIATT